MPNRKSVGLNHLELGQKLRLSKNLKDLYSTSYKVDGPQQVRNSGVQTSARSIWEKSKQSITEVFDENTVLIQDEIAWRMGNSPSRANA